MFPSNSGPSFCGTFGASASPLTMWMQPLSALRRGADHWLYPVNRLSGDERANLSMLDGEDCAALVADARELRIFRSLEALMRDPSVEARIAVVAGPGAGPLGAAALARETSLALGEPVFAAPSAYDAADWLAECSGVFTHWLEGDNAASRPEALTLSALLKEPRYGVDLVVGHGLGAWTAAKTLARLDQSHRARLRLVSFGAAPTPPSDLESFAVIGGADVFGWSLTCMDAEIADVPAGSAHHLNQNIWGWLDIRTPLQRIESEPRR